MKIYFGLFCGLSEFIDEQRICLFHAQKIVAVLTLAPYIGMHGQSSGQPSVIKLLTIRLHI